MKTVIKRLFAGLVVALAISSIAHAAGPLKIGYSDWPGWVAWEVAIERWFKDAGVDVDSNGSITWRRWMRSLPASWMP